MQTNLQCQKAYHWIPREEAEGHEGSITKGQIWGLIYMFTILIVLIVCRVYAYVKSYQIVHFMCNSLHVNYTSICLLGERGRERERCTNVKNHLPKNFPCITI